MWRIPARFWLVSSFLLAGMAFFCPAEAADATDDEFKALVDQDAKLIAKAVEAVDKATTAKDKKLVGKSAGSGIKSSAMIMAGYANARITGNPAVDGKAAAIRDEAIKIYKAAAEGNFKAAAEAAKGLADVKASANPKKIDLFKQFPTDVTSKDVMINFMKPAQYGTNVEADVIANGKKATAKPADVALIAHRLLAMGEYSKTIIKPVGAKDIAAWKEFNDKMISTTEALLATTKKKTTASDLAKAFTAVNASCVACHEDYKN
ncbi:MAG: hypothetical protein EXS09_12290 [Gemmataceae bacterium]|nr:hypothetical protein [Gemmataceae bacterium]